LDKIFLALVPGLMLLLVLCEISDRYAVRWLSWLAKKKRPGDCASPRGAEGNPSESLSKLASAVSSHVTKARVDQPTPR
jgi:hypothetical protein